MRLFDHGYHTLCWLGPTRIPVRLHWTLIPGCLLWTRLAILPFTWLALLCVFAIHEAGHALVARRQFAVVRGIDLHALGGRCTWQGYVRPLGRAKIAAAGVAAQALLIPFGLALFYFSTLLGEETADVARVLTWTNLWIAALNLLPIAPLDGAEAWSLIRLSRLDRQRRALQDELRQLAPPPEPTEKKPPRLMN